MGILSIWINSDYAWTLILVIVMFFTFITVLFYYTRDKYEPEPISKIAQAFLYGVLSVIPAVIISIIGLALLGNNMLIFAILLAPLIEEFSKAYFVVQLSKDDTFDGPLDGLIYGAMVGSGFATIENLLYGLGTSYINVSSGVELTFYRSIPQIIGHPLYTGLVGAGIGAYKVGLIRNKYQNIWMAILLHSMWNLSASLTDPLMFFGGIAIVVTFSIIQLRKELKKAIELDRKAYESGYYDKKKIYLEQKRKIREQQKINHINWIRQMQQSPNSRQPNNWQTPINDQQFHLDQVQESENEQFPIEDEEEY